MHINKLNCIKLEGEDGHSQPGKRLSGVLEYFKKDQLEDKKDTKIKDVGAE